jgi:hypothetical protein
MKKALLLCIALLVSSPAAADIVSTTGLAVVPAPSSPITADFIINQGLPSQLIFVERQNVTLGAALATDTGTIAAGTVVNSYFFGVNALDCCTNLRADTSVTFDGQVLGVVYKEDAAGIPSSNYALTSFLGVPGLSYFGQSCTYCGFEIFGNQGGSFRDNIVVSGNTVDFHNAYSQPGDFARVVVAQPAAVPGPIVGAGIPGLVAACVGLIGFARRRRRHI